jgi:adenylate cyclase
MKNKEIERKFLVNPENIPYDLKKMDYRDITQGYVTSIDNTFVFRLRHVLYRSHLDGDLMGEEFFQTIKGKGTKIRDEFEIKLWKKQFSTLWRLCETLNLHKFRFELPHPDGRMYLDEYKNGLRGLYTVEVEFETEEECDSYNPPKWFGEEVTEDVTYSNLQLAMNGLPKKEIV